MRSTLATSMFKTLAGKHKSTVSKMARTYKTRVDTANGSRVCFQVTVQRDQGRRPLVARFGGIPLTRQRTAVITDLKPVMATTRRNELIHRLLAGRCELCQGQVSLQVHHIRKLADLDKPGRPDRPAWVHLIAMRKRKTLVVCEHCHQDIHAGRATATTRNKHWRAVCAERRTYRSGRGRRKRTRTTGTSPAAYFTLWEPEGETPSGYPTLEPTLRRQREAAAGTERQK